MNHAAKCIALFSNAKRYALEYLQGIGEYTIYLIDGVSRKTATDEVARAVSALVNARNQADDAYE